VKIKQALSVALIVVAIASGVAALGYVAWNMMKHTGVHAVEQMNAQERELLKRVALVRSTMSMEQVYGILGEPTSDLFQLAKWDGFGGSQLSQLRIYVVDGHPRKVRWAKLGYFFYDRDL
jgi:hypothetical protein